MSQPTAEMVQAADQAALRVKALLLEMFMAQDLGEVAVMVYHDHLRPQKRITDKYAAIKLKRGHWTALQEVE